MKKVRINKDIEHEVFSLDRLFAGMSFNTKWNKRGP
jgi:hypothetical protein